LFYNTGNVGERFLSGTLLTDSTRRAIFYFQFIVTKNRRGNQSI